MDVLFDDEFVKAFMHSIVIMCCNGVARHGWAWLIHTAVYPIIFTFLSHSLHCWSTTIHPTTMTSCMSLCTHSHTTLAFAPSDQPCLVDEEMIYDSHVYISFLSYDTHPPVAWPITNHHTMKSGTYYSFASDEPCARFLDYHLYLACLYPPFTTHDFALQYTSFPQISFSCIHLASHIHLALFCIFSPSCIALHCLTIFTCYATPRDNLIPLIAPSEPHRIYA